MQTREELNLADTIKGEINRMCVTDDIAELDTMALHARRNIERLQSLRYASITADTPQTETQMKTQNSNLTFEKDECAKEYEELGLKELKELIEADRKTEPSNSENPNNCEHITEDGVTCAKYPACDDCLDNPLNKVKGSERLVKGSEQTEPTISKMEQVEEPQMGDAKPIPLSNRVTHIKDEPKLK